MPRVLPTLTALLCVAPAALLAASPGPSTPSLVVGHGADRFPDESLSDWVSFADQLSAVTVIREEEAPDDDVLSRGEGYISRTVTLSVENTFWNRPGAPSVSGTFDVITDGWLMADGRRAPFALEGGPRLEVGSTYLVPLVRAPRDGAEWTPLSTGSTLEMEGDAISIDDVAGEPGAIARSLVGASGARVGAILHATAPDPGVVGLLDLPPDARAEAVVGGR